MAGVTEQFGYDASEKEPRNLEPVARRVRCHPDNRRALEPRTRQKAACSFRDCSVCSLEVPVLCLKVIKNLAWEPLLGRMALGQLLGRTVPGLPSL